MLAELAATASKDSLQGLLTDCRNTGNQMSVQIKNLMRDTTKMGNSILQFMRDNNIPTDHVNVFPDGKSPVSLAFLNEQSDAEYIF